MNTKHQVPAAYLRRSSVSAGNPGDASREAQEAAVRRLCGDDVVLYIDWGISGRSAERRPEYLRLKADIDAGRVASVCAYSLSRLGRNARELLAFIELAQANNVPVRTAVESIDTGTAMGRAMLTVMAAFAQLELETGMERSEAAREVRRNRGDTLGRAPFGYLLVQGDDKVWRTVRDHDDDRLDAVIAAYREAGTYAGAAQLLAERGVTSPTGKTAWSLATVRATIQRELPHEIPAEAASGIRRRVKRDAMFARLLVCHCGRVLTYQAAKNGYYCSKATSLGAAVHGRAFVLEKRIRPFAEAQAARLLFPKQEEHQARLQSIDADRKAMLEHKIVGLLEFVGEWPADQIRAKRAVYEKELEQIEEAEVQAQGPLFTVVPEGVDFSQPPGEVNAALTSIWHGIRLDKNLDPLPLEADDWKVPEWYYDEDAFAAYEASIAGSTPG